ncbi:MAG: small, acid-soluble spore protein, alpha/beta type [Bacillota bacterium]
MRRNTETNYRTISGKSVGRRRTGILVPEAEKALNNLKHRVAADLGIDFTLEDKGSFTAKDCGKVGGEMVRRIIEQVKYDMTRAGSNRYQ